MIATEYTSGMSLLEWGNVIGLSPWLLAQVLNGFPDEAYVGGCLEGLFQHPYQGAETLSRDEVVDTIDRAEHDIEKVIGFYPVQRFISNEQVAYPNYFNRGAFGGQLTPRRQNKGIRLATGKIQGVGIESLTLIEAGAALTRSDTDGDGIKNRFTMTVTISDTTIAADEIALFFTETDRNGELKKYYEVKPIQASISGTTLTITGHAALCIKPSLYTRINPQQLDVSEDSNYVTTFDVYRRHLDTGTQATLVWENPPNYQQNSSVTTIATTAQLRDAESGIVAFEPKYAPLWANGREPDRLTVSYLAGMPRDNGRVHQKYRRAVAILAAAYLPNKTKGCARADQRLSYYKALPANDDNILTANPAIMDLASGWFGTQVRGAVECAAMLQSEQSWGVNQF